MIYINGGLYNAKIGVISEKTKIWGIKNKNLPTELSDRTNIALGMTKGKARQEKGDLWAAFFLLVHKSPLIIWWLLLQQIEGLTGSQNVVYFLRVAVEFER